MVAPAATFAVDRRGGRTCFFKYPLDRSFSKEGEIEKRGGGKGDEREKERKRKKEIEKRRERTKAAKRSRDRT